jgi:flagellar motor switch protein FliN/FliY
MSSTDTPAGLVADSRLESLPAESESLQPQQFAEAISDSLTQRQEQSLAVIMDIPVTLSLELGRNRISIRELLQLTQGSIVKLDRPAGEPLDILVNGCLVARGEVVVVNERFGVRITDIVSPEERVRRLR